METKLIIEYDKEFTFIFDSFIEHWISDKSGHTLTLSAKGGNGTSETFDMEKEEDIRRYYINEIAQQDDLFNRINELTDIYIKNIYISQDMANHIYQSFFEDKISE